MIIDITLIKYNKWCSQKAIRDIKKQLAAAANDPNLTIITSHHWPIEVKPQLPPFKVADFDVPDTIVDGRYETTNSGDFHREYLKNLTMNWPDDPDLGEIE